MSVKQFKLSIFYAVDISSLISPESKSQFLSMRSDGSLFDYLIASINESSKNGPFKIMGDEGLVIKEQIERSLTLGGKNIYSTSFFEQYAPYWFRGTNESDLNNIIRKPTGATITCNDLDLDYTDQNLEYCIYEGCELRIFRDGTLSFRFSFSNTREKKCIPINELIQIIRCLESHTYLAFQKRITELSLDWSSNSHRLQNNDFGLKFIKCDLKSMDANINSVVSRYRFLVIDTLYMKNLNNNSYEGQDISKLDIMKILGLLNLAIWYEKYSKNYVTENQRKALGYKDNEIFLCDGTASLVVLPELWSEPRQTRYVSDLLMLSELINAQLTYIQAIGSSLETNILLPPNRKKGSEDETIRDALLMKGLILQMEKTGDIDGFVSHGFTRKFLELVRSELYIPNRVNAIHRRMESVDARISMESELKLSNYGLSTNRKGVQLAIIALILSAILQIIQVLPIILDWIKSY